MHLLPPEEWVRFLRSNGIRRAYFIFDRSTGRVRASHPVLEPLAEFLQQDRRDYDQHEGIFVQVTRQHHVLQGAFIHRTCRGQAQGGTRFWPYETVEGFLRDGIRLSRGMTLKNALAGLWWGGGKGVIARNGNFDYRDPEVRRVIFEEYGELTTSLRGAYITAEDVGTDTRDMAHIHHKTRFATCIPTSMGGSGNPSIATARGTVAGMEAALEFLKMGDLTGKTVAVQGMGHVGEPMIGFLFEKNVQSVVACDISSEQVQSVRSRFSGKNLEAFVAPRGDTRILEAPCDILAPAATGGILNAKSIEQIRARIICGPANNQLEEPDRDSSALHARGILYLPDFLVNRMGIVNCANEQYGNIDSDPAIERHFDRRWDHSIHQIAMKVLHRAQTENRSPAPIAVELADELSREPHPIFGHRGQGIIDSLVKNHWERE